MTIFKFLQSFALVILISDYLERKHTDEFKNFICMFSYNIIFAYSKAQILYVKLEKKVNLLIESSPTMLKIKNDFNSIILNAKISQQIKTEFIKNGDFIEIETVRENNLIIPVSTIDYDFAIVNNLNANDGCINKSLTYKNSSITNDYEVSNIQFMLVELIVGEKNENKLFKIVLKNEIFNFYIVGNILSREFFSYYLKNIHESKFDLEEIEVKNIPLTIKIIDHDVNKIEINLTDKNEHILIEKSGYKLNIVNHLETDDN
jgi:hypothetical protein